MHDSLCILNRFRDLAGARCSACWGNEMPHVPGKGQAAFLIRGSMRRLLSLQLPPRGSQSVSDGCDAGRIFVEGKQNNNTKAPPAPALVWYQPAAAKAFAQVFCNRAVLWCLYLPPLSSLSDEGAGHCFSLINTWETRQQRVGKQQLPILKLINTVQVRPLKLQTKGLRSNRSRLRRVPDCFSLPSPGFSQISK